jgi:hypothetical protein
MAYALRRWADADLVVDCARLGHNHLDSESGPVRPPKLGPWTLLFNRWRLHRFGQCAPCRSILSDLEAPAENSSRTTSCADCITSIDVHYCSRHGRPPWNRQEVTQGISTEAHPASYPL